jgi:hypothetical protein
MLLIWRVRSRSNNNGGSCVEVSKPPTQFWRATPNIEKVAYFESLSTTSKGCSPPSNAAS